MRRALAYITFMPPAADLGIHVVAFVDGFALFREDLVLVGGHVGDSYMICAWEIEMCI
jgi:hypothetical protein